MKVLVLFVFLIMTISTAFAGAVAEVMKLKGEVKVLVKNKLTVLAVGDEIEEGNSVLTSKGSFTQIKFMDNSVMNIAPNSNVLIHQFKKSKPGIIGLLKGKIRTKVSKDYMNMPKGKSKLFIKTSSVAMGVRGTDFEVSHNVLTGETTMVVFEGKVAMVSLKKNYPFAKLNDELLDRLLNAKEGIIVPGGKLSIGKKGQKIYPALELTEEILEEQNSNLDFSNFEKLKGSKLKDISSEKYKKIKIEMKAEASRKEKALDDAKLKREEKTAGKTNKKLSKDKPNLFSADDRKEVEKKKEIKRKRLKQEEIEKEQKKLKAKFSSIKGAAKNKIDTSRTAADKKALLKDYKENLKNKSAIGSLTAPKQGRTSTATSSSRSGYKSRYVKRKAALRKKINATATSGTGVTGGTNTGTSTRIFLKGTHGSGSSLAELYNNTIRPTIGNKYNSSITKPKANINTGINLNQTISLEDAQAAAELAAAQDELSAQKGYEDCVTNQKKVRKISPTAPLSAYLQRNKEIESFCKAGGDTAGTGKDGTGQ